VNPLRPESGRAESFIAMTGQPTLTALSIRLQIFFDCISAMVPPMLVKS